MEQTNNTKMLTIIEAEKLIGVSRYSIEYKCRNGLIPGAELRDGDCFIPLQWVSQQRNMIDMSNMLTTTEAHNPCPSFQDLCRMGQVPGVELIGRTYYIPKKWLEENKHKVYGDYLRYQRHQHSKIYKIGRHDGKLSLRQVSEIVGVSHMAIIYAIKKGQIIQDDEGFSLQSLEKYIESKYNRKSEHNLLTIPFAALLLGVEVNVIDAAIETGNITLLKKNKINIDKLESVLKTGDGLTTKEAAVKAKVPRSAIYLALTVGQISYNNGAGINIEELTDFVKNCPLAGCTEQPTADNDEEVSKKENTMDNSLLTLKEAAEFAGVRYDTIMRWLRKGNIQKTGKAIKREEIIRFLQIWTKRKIGRHDGKLSLRQVSEIVGVSHMAIIYAIKKGQIIQDDEGFSLQSLEKYIESKYNRKSVHNLLTIPFAALLLGVAVNAIDAAIKAGKVTLLKKNKINIDELESVLKTGDGLTTKEAAVKAKVPRSAIYLALTVGQISYNNGAGINIEELTDFVKNCPLAGCTEHPTADNDEEVSKKENTRDNSFLTFKEAAEFAGVSYATILEWLRKGKIQESGKAIKREEIIKYMQKRQKPKADFERLTRTEAAQIERLTRTEAAQIAGVPAVAIRTAIKSGKITTSGRGVTPDELLIFLKKRKLREFGYIDEETLSIDQAAKIVGVTRQTICRARDKGHLKTSNGGFQIAELKRYTKACRGIDIDVPPVPDVEPASFGFLNQEEAARIVGVSLLTLDSAVKFGLLRKIGKYILRSDLDKYIVGHDESAGHT